MSKAGGVFCTTHTFRSSLLVTSEGECGEDGIARNVQKGILGMWVGWRASLRTTSFLCLFPNYKCAETNKNMPATRMHHLNEPWRKLSLKKCLSCGEERKMPESVHTALFKSSWWKWDAVFLRHPLPLSPPSPAASGLCLCDANCFCYLCQVPTLPQHILQTGPGPSAAFCVCLRNKKMCTAICGGHATVLSPPPPGCDCHRATMMHIHVLSQRKKKKTLRGIKQENKTDTYNC